MGVRFYCNRFAVVNMAPRQVYRAMRRLAAVPQILLDFAAPFQQDFKYSGHPGS